MYASVDGRAFWLPNTLQQQRWEKKKEVDKPFTLVQCECRMLEYEHLFRHHPGARRWDLNSTRWYLWLN